MIWVWNPTHNSITSSISSNMVDDNDKIIKHKPKANDSWLEKNSPSKLHIHLVCVEHVEKED